MRKIYLALLLALLTGRPVTVIAAVSLLGEAVDAPDLAWETYGDALWTAQTAVTHDGLDAAQSGAFLNGASTLHTYVTGPGTVSFWWKVSSETNIDAFRFYVGGEVLAQISGSVDWEQRTFAVPAGAQELKWEIQGPRNDRPGPGLARSGPVCGRAADDHQPAGQSQRGRGNDGAFQGQRHRHAAAQLPMAVQWS